MNAETRGAEMEAHSGAVTFPNDWVKAPRRHRLRALRERLRALSGERAARRYAVQANRSLPGSIPGSEHTHLLRRPRGF